MLHQPGRNVMACSIFLSWVKSTIMWFILSLAFAFRDRRNAGAIVTLQTQTHNKHLQSVYNKDNKTHLTDWEQECGNVMKENINVNHSMHIHTHTPGESDEMKMSQTLLIKITRILLTKNKLNELMIKWMDFQGRSV